MKQRCTLDDITVTGMIYLPLLHVCVCHTCVLFRQAVFLWIVVVINTSLGKGDESLPFIGVLDIFGKRDRNRALLHHRLSGVH